MAAIVRFMANEPQLKRGCELHDWVAYLQQTLIDRGFDPGPVDGIFGPLTEAGVRAFQEGAGIRVDGIVGPETWGAINGGGGGAEEPEGELESVTVYFEPFRADGAEALSLGGDELVAIQSDELPSNLEGVDYSRRPDVA